MDTDRPPEEGPPERAQPNRDMDTEGDADVSASGDDDQGVRTSDRRRTRAARANAEVDADADAEEEDSEDDAGPIQDDDAGPQRRRRVQANTLFDVIHMLLGGGARAASQNNDELVDSLVRSRNIRDQRVAWALRTLSRQVFVPTRHVEDAFVDAPLHVPSMNFNISAPHMYAICLEALHVTPGAHVLDIGSGCGHMTALVAILAGPEGSSTGLEVRIDLVEFAESNIQKVLQTSLSLSASERQALSAVRFVARNCFLPDAEQRQYDRVHVGASCPIGYLDRIVALLQPNGGIAVLPCGEELLKLTRVSETEVERQVLAQVRYGDLVLPSPAEVLQAVIDNDRANARCIKPKQDTTCLGEPRDRNISTTEMSETITEQLLLYIYRDQPPAVDGSSVLDLLHWAIFFQIPRLITLCETAAAELVDIENVCEILDQSDKLSSVQLKRFCLAYCLERFPTVTTTSAYKNLPRELVTEIALVAYHQLALAFPFHATPGKPSAIASLAADAELPSGAGRFEFRDVPPEPAESTS